MIANRAHKLTKDAVEEIAAQLAAHYGESYEKGVRWASYAPTVVEGDHEGSDCAWIVSWEEAPDSEWVYAEALDEIVRNVLGEGWFAEPLNHFSVAFWN